MTSSSTPDDTYSDRETERRREAALKRMLSTSPTRHTKSKVSRKATTKSRQAKKESGAAS